MQSNPVVRKMAVREIFITDGPTNSAHLAYAYKLCLPRLVTTKALLGRFAKCGSLRGIAGATPGFQIVEIVLVQHHAVVFETEAAIQLGVFSELVLINLGPLDELGNFFVQSVCFFDITFIELEVHLECLIRNALQVAQIELPGFISRKCHPYLPQKLWRNRSSRDDA